MNEIYILGGVSMGLFLAICLYGYKKMSLGDKDVKKQCCSDDSFEIEEWKSEIEDDPSYRISMDSKCFLDWQELPKIPETYLTQKKQDNIPISLLANVLKDLAETLDQTKEMKVIIKSHENILKKSLAVNKALEKRIGKLEGHIAKMGTLSVAKEDRGLKNSDHSFCACKPGDSVACI